MNKDLMSLITAEPSELVDISTIDMEPYFDEHDPFNNKRIIHDMEQGTDKWLLVRKQKVTGSPVYKIVTAQEGKALTQTAEGYLNELIGDWMSPHYVAPQLSNKACAWGHENEPLAREEFDFAYDVEVVESGFIEVSRFIGCSADGVFLDSDKVKSLLEIKCPYTPSNTVKHIKMRTRNEGNPKKQIPSNYYWQCVYNSLVCECEKFYFVSFDPRNTGVHRLSVVEVLLSNIAADVEKVKKAVIYFTRLLEKELNELNIIKIK